MTSPTDRVRPGRPAGAGDRQPISRSYQSRWAPDPASEKRSQSKPLVLTLSVSIRCSDFLEIEAIEAIALVFRCLRREKARFSGTKDRHAAGFIPEPGRKAGAWLCAPARADTLPAQRISRRAESGGEPPSEQSWNVLKNQVAKASGSYPKANGPDFGPDLLIFPL
jgi:hypothetical protein